MGNKTKNKHGRAGVKHQGRVTRNIKQQVSDEVRAQAYHRGWVAGHAEALQDAETFAHKLAAQKSIAAVRKLVLEEYGDGTS